MSFEDEVKLLRRRGHKVVVYERNNRELAGLSTIAMIKRLFWNRDAYNDVKKLIQEHRPDVMHCTNTFPLMSVSVYDAANELNVPIVQSFRNYRLFCANSVCVLKGKPCQKCLRSKFAFSAIKNKCYRNSRSASLAVACLQAYLRINSPWKKKVTLMYTLSKFARDKLIEAGIPKAKIVVKPNFVNEPLKPGDGSGDFAVFAGRLSHEKGIKTLMTAWEQLDIPLKLIVLGDGPQRHLVTEMAEKDERVIWKGRRAKKEVFDLIGEAKFLVMPSISFETFGRTIIEAYSMNTPVIGSIGGAIGENIIDGETGLHFETGNANDLAAKVKFLMSNPELTSQMRINAGRAFKAKYTEEQNYQLLLQIYDSAWERHHGQEQSAARFAEPTNGAAVPTPKMNSLIGLDNVPVKES